MVRLNLQRFGEETEPMDSPAGDVTGGEATGTTEHGRTDFRQLIAGEYRKDYEKAVGQRIQAAIQQRFKNQQDYKKQLDAVQPILQTLGGRYGLNAEDVAGIADRLRQEPDNAQNPEPADTPAAAHDYMQEHVRGVNAQVEALKKEFPGFDLMAEMRNPAFVRMTSPGVGMSVKDAYFAVHGQEIQRDSMLYAAQQAGERVAASVMAGASRPRENGLDPAGSADMGVNVQSMDRKTRAEYRRRIRNGEKINFIRRFAPPSPQGEGN